MSDAGDIAALTVALHERDTPHADTALLEARVLDLEAQLAEARGALEAHLAAYHAPEPEPEEEEHEEEPEEEPEPDAAPPPEEKEPEPAPEPERIPENTHVLMRGILTRG